MNFFFRREFHCSTENLIWQLIPLVTFGLAQNQEI
jgi:hypothetical protein